MQAGGFNLGIRAVVADQQVRSAPDVEVGYHALLLVICGEKGLRAERAIVAARAEFGLKAERVPLSKASRYRGNGADVG